MAAAAHPNQPPTPVVALTAAHLDRLARQAHWSFDVKTYDTVDTVVMRGDGVDDLDQLLALIDRHAPRIKVLVDVGVQHSDFRLSGRADVVALRAKYVEIHGEVTSPQTWETL